MCNSISRTPYLIQTPIMFIRAYLRASTEEQDAGRARASLEQFASDHNKVIASVYLENASGATADRPELLRLLKDASKGDVLLVESIDRLSRLPVEDWQKLKAAIDAKGLRIVALDLPTSHQGIEDNKGDEFTNRMLGAINSMLVEMMAAIARKDYEQRRDRQTQGIEKAKAAGKYQRATSGCGPAQTGQGVTESRSGHPRDCTSCRLLNHYRATNSRSTKPSYQLLNGIKDQRRSTF